jgi:hypothetical protein
VLQHLDKDVSFHFDQAKGGYAVAFQRCKKLADGTLSCVTEPLFRVRPRLVFVHGQTMLVLNSRDGWGDRFPMWRLESL